MILKSFKGATTGEATIDSDTILKYFSFVDYPNAVVAMKELPDNSCSHGGASKFRVHTEYDEEGVLQKIIFCDNGVGLLSTGNVGDCRHYQTATGLKRNNNYQPNSIGHHGAGLLQFMVQYANTVLFASKHGSEYHVCTVSDPQNSLDRDTVVIDSSHEDYTDIDNTWNLYNNGETQGLMIELVPRQGTWDIPDLEKAIEAELSITYTDKFKKDNCTMDMSINNVPVDIKAFEDFVDIHLDKTYTHTWDESGVKVTGKVRVRAGINKKGKNSQRSPFRRINISLGGRQISLDSKFGVWALRSANAYNYPGMAIHLDFDEVFRSPLNIPPTKCSSFEDGAHDSVLTKWLMEWKSGPELKSMVNGYCVRQKKKNTPPDQEEWKKQVARYMNSLTKKASREPHVVSGLRGIRKSGKVNSTGSPAAARPVVTSPRVPSKGNPSTKQRYAVELADLGGNGAKKWFEQNTVDNILTITFDISHVAVKQALYEKTANNCYKKDKNGNPILKNCDDSVKWFLGYTISLAQTVETHSDLTSPTGVNMDDFLDTLAQSVHVKSASMSNLPNYSPP